MRQLIAANSQAAPIAPHGPLAWITEAKTALGRNQARDRAWLMDWQKRNGRSLGYPGKNPQYGDLVETCIRMGLPGEPLFGACGPATFPPCLLRLPTMKAGEFLTTTNEI